MEHSIFCGRENELQQLKDSWHRLKNKPDYHTEVHVLTAESGMGKTRIVQEFYNWLSANADGSSAEGYWPDALGKNKRSLEISPSPDLCNAENELTYLWLGVRCTDTGRHNGVRDGEALQTEMRAFECHLGVFVDQAQRRKGLKSNALAVLSDLALQLAGALSGFDTAIGVSKIAFDAIDRHTGTNNSAPPEPYEIALAAIRILFEQTHDIRLPLVLVLDDIQFSQGERSISKLTRQLIAEAGEHHWPLMVIATSWHKEWVSRDENCLLIDVLQNARDQRHIRAENLKVIPILPIRTSRMDAGLEPLVRSKLPGLTLEQTKAVVEHVDGNPRFLEELLLHLEIREDLFVDLDKAGTLESGAIDEIEKLDIEKLIETRIRAAGPEVFRPLALGGLQGMKFSERFARELQQSLGVTDPIGQKDSAFKKGESPFGFIQRETGGFAEFIQRPYQQIAVGLLRTFVKPISAADDALKSLLTAYVEDPSELSDLECLHCCDLLLRHFESHKDEKGQKSKALAWRRIADLKQHNLNYQESVEAYDKAVQIMTELKDALGDLTPSSSLSDIAAAHMGRGTVLLKMLKLKPSLEAYDEAIRINYVLKNALGHSTPSNLLNDIASAHVSRGNTLQEMNELELSLEAYDEAIRITSELKHSSGDPIPPSALHDIAAAHMNKGIVLHKMQKLELSVEAHDEAIRIMSELKDTLGNPTPAIFLNSLAAAHVNKGNSLQKIPKLELSLEAYDEAIRIRSELKDILGEKTPPSFLNDIASAYMCRGNTLLEMNELELSLDAYDETIRIRSELKDSFGKRLPLSFLHDIAVAHLNKSIALHRIEKRELSVEARDKAIRIMFELKDTLGNPTPAIFLNSLATALMHKGITLRDADELERSLEAYDEAIRIMAELKDAPGDSTPPSLIKSLTAAHMTKGIVHNKMDEWELSVAAYDEAIRIMAEHKDTLEDPIPPDLLDGIATAYLKKGNALLNMQKLELSVEAYNEAIRIMAELKASLGNSTPMTFLKLLAFIHMNRKTAFEKIRKRDL